MKNSVVFLGPLFVLNLKECLVYITYLDVCTQKQKSSKLLDYLENISL